MITTGMRNYQIVLDRLGGMSFEAIARKNRCRNASQARGYYQNSLAHLVNNSLELKKLVLKLANKRAEQ